MNKSLKTKNRQIDLSIIILSFNVKELLRDCLNSLKKVKNIVFETLVIDNGGNDDSAEMVKKEFPAVELLVSKINRGFAGGNNLARGGAAGRYLLFLNPDTIVPEGTLETMVKFMDEHPKCGAATCRVELTDGKLDDACHRGFPTPINAFSQFFLPLGRLFPKVKLFNGYSLSYLPLKEAHQIDSCSGAFMMVRRKAAETSGWWDEDYWWYGEDLDWCYRLKEKGWEIWFVSQVKIIHYKGASGGLAKGRWNPATDKQTKIKATNARFEVMKIFYDKHYQDKYPRWTRYLVLAGVEIKKWWEIKKLKI